MHRPASILSTAQQIRRGLLHPRELVERCLTRIARYESRVHAWVSVDEQGARQAAGRLGDELQNGRDRGPLHGIPIGIKDIINVEGWPTRAGSPLRTEHMATHDATLVARLRAAGAIILGKTVTTEYACFDPPPTRNPWNLACTPGGSSSGSAAAVALGMCLAAIGSQTGGSITRPASYCGVAGCKPTLGRVSVAGVVPVSFHLDHPGPIAAHVSDLAVMLGAIAGYDESDPLSIDAPTPDYVAGLESGGFPRLGLIETFFLTEADEPVRSATLAAINRLRAAGAEVVNLSPPTDFTEALARHRCIMAVEAAAYHRDSFTAQRDAYGPRISQLLDEGLAAAAADYAVALHHRAWFRGAMQRLLDGVDALVTPAAPTTAPATLETTGDPKFNSPWSYAGLPTVNIPCGLADDGLPVGLQFTGAHLGEPRLLAAAAWCENTLAFEDVPPLLNPT